MHLKGVIGLDAVKPVLAEPEAACGLVVVFDIMHPVSEKVTPETLLQDAINTMRETKLKCLPVVEEDGEDKFVGFLDARVLNRVLSSELASRRKAIGEEVEH